jgi:N-acetylglutamate synthase
MAGGRAGSNGRIGRPKEQVTTTMEQSKERNSNPPPATTSAAVFVLGPRHHRAMLELWQRAGLETARPNGRDGEAAFREQIERGSVTALGVEEQGRLIAVVLASHDGRKGWINRLAVDPSSRGRGLGTLLTRAAEETLRDRGMTVIAALIEPGNEPSLALFRRLGYVEPSAGIHYLSKRTSEDA